MFAGTLVGVAVVWWFWRGDVAGESPESRPQPQPSRAPSSNGPMPTMPRAETTKSLPPIPPYPRDLAPPQPKFLLYRDLKLDHGARPDAVAVYATPGPMAAFQAQLAQQSWTPDQRLEAQKPSFAERSALFTERGKTVEPILGALPPVQRALWGQGSTSLLNWFNDRHVELSAAVGDAPPTDEVIAHLACPVAEAAAACRELGYQTCASMDVLRERADPICDEALARLAVQDP